MVKDIKNVDEYIHQFPKDIQEILVEIRRLIKQKASDAQESISYGMPGYTTFGKPLVYFAAFKNHIGFYASPTGHAEFAEELSKYKHGKGSVQFPLSQSIPFDLICKIIEFREKENKLNA